VSTFFGNGAQIQMNGKLRNEMANNSVSVLVHFSFWKWAPIVGRTSLLW